MKPAMPPTTYRSSLSETRCFTLGAAALLAVAAFAGAPAHAARQKSAAPVPAAVQGEGALCDAAIRDAERGPRGPIRSSQTRLPQGLLAAIGMVESGRADPKTGRAAPWPWTINVAGEDHFYATKEEAIAGVETAHAAGVQSIDVGCMQVNLMYHPTAFASLDQAFDPQTNAAYAADFIGRLFVQIGDWPHAAAAYHSQTPGISEPYGRRVMANWPQGTLFGGVDVFGPPEADGTGAPAISPAVSAAKRVDPYNIYTPEFRQRLIADAADRARREAALGPVAKAGSPVAGGPARRPIVSPLLRDARSRMMPTTPTRFARAGL